jgi:hypothetical protein
MIPPHNLLPSKQSQAYIDLALSEATEKLMKRNKLATSSFGATACFI